MADVDPGIREFQERIEALYLDRDRARGLSRTFMWFVEEVGELSSELLVDEPDPDRLEGEFADVLAWLVSLGSLAGVDVAAATAKYADGCPRCGETPCECP